MTPQSHLLAQDFPCRARMGAGWFLVAYKRIRRLTLQRSFEKPDFYVGRKRLDWLPVGCAHKVTGCVPEAYKTKPGKGPKNLSVFRVLICPLVLFLLERKTPPGVSLDTGHRGAPIRRLCGQLRSLKETLVCALMKLTFFVFCTEEGADFIWDLFWGLLLPVSRLLRDPWSVNAS